MARAKKRMRVRGKAAGGREVKRIEDYKEHRVERGDLDQQLRCSHCHALLHEHDVFCKRCGAKVKRSERREVKVCPHCKSTVEDVAVFCRHCGGDLRRVRKGHHVHVLLYVITLLLVLLVLLIFFSYPVSRDAGEVGEDVSMGLDITDLSCEWTGNGFKVCEAVEWMGREGDYAKGYIAGGENLESSMKQFGGPFTYCQSVGSEEGFRIARAVAFDSGGGSYDEVGEGVECRRGEMIREDERKVQEFVAAKPYEFTKRVYFNAQRNTGHGLGFGVVEIKLPGDPMSCTVDGYWESDNEGRGTSGIKRYCHKARGILQGYVDFYEQYVVEDPDYFMWAGPSKPKANPLEKRYEGEILHARLCDNSYYQEDGERYIAIGKVVDFSKDLKIEWSYVNEDTMPVVNFIFDLRCLIKS